MPRGSSRLRLEFPHAGDTAAELLAAVSRRGAQITTALAASQDGALEAPSLLPTWSRLTIACHLRYGAMALLRMTEDALAGRATAYYPQGRASQRDGTLVPDEGETAADVVASLADADARLHDVWAGLKRDDWELSVREPEDNPDLGVLPLSRLLLARLTEVEVHGSDLDLGLPDWSAVFVEHALPFRLGWLNTRRSNHRAIDSAVVGSWQLTPDGGLPWQITALPDGSVRSRPAVDERTPPKATISASARDLLALLLGRPTQEPLRYGGDVDFAEAFNRAFPGP